MAQMLDRFLKLKVCITKALMDLESDIIFTQQDWKTLSELNEILDIVKTIVESLSRRDASLLTADIAIKFALKKLMAMDTDISKQMANSLKKRYCARRLIESSTLYYLSNPRQYFEDIIDEDLATFPRHSSDEMCRSILKLVSLGTNDDNIISDMEQQDQDENDFNLAPPTLSKSEELDLELRKATT
jgi:hypothetical protein